jgi:hypothetical protein
MRGILRVTGRLLWLLLATNLVVWALVGVRAVDPGDQLHRGQDLVDQATGEIDRRVAVFQDAGLQTPELYQGIVDLLEWLVQFREETVATRFRLDEPDGLLITDGIADTLSTRLHTLLQSYVTQRPQEALGPGRQALELEVGRFPLPPGSVLGFHVEHLLQLYQVVADTLLAHGALTDSDGVQDGFLRHAWDLSQLHEQYHRRPGDRYLCRIEEENWILQRSRCEECGHRGLRFQNQRMGLREDTTAACREALANMDSSPEAILGRLDCRYWGHLFDVKCPECGHQVYFSVPLPDYKVLQKGIAVGADSFDIERLIRRQ